MSARSAADDRPVVLFLDDGGWRCFDQLAAYLRRIDVRPVRIAQRPTPNRLRRLTDRWLYDEVVDLTTDSGLVRIGALLDSGSVLDVQVNERALAQLGPSSALAERLAHAAIGQPDGSFELLDKVVVGDRMRAAAGLVPEQVIAHRFGPSDAVDQLGLPMVVKRRLGTGGGEVRIVDSVAAAERAVSDLGGDREGMFYERYLPGGPVYYLAVVGPDGVVQDVVGSGQRALGHPRGPSIGVTVLDAPAVVAEGRRLVECLGLRGFAALEFLEDADGRCVHIDLSTRVWGNVLATLDEGLDLFAGYRFVLGLGPRPAPVELMPGRDHAVQPRQLRAAAVGRDVRALRAQIGPFVRAYRPVVGVRYLALIAIEMASVLVSSIRR